MSKSISIDMQESVAEAPKIYKASRILQTKVGTGSIDPGVVEKCQDIMDNNDVDFIPLATEFLDKLSEAIDRARTQNLAHDEAVHSLTAPVMQLKANAGAFKYPLMGNLSNVMLSFLETVKELDDDAVAIVTAHYETLSAIILKKMDGNGGEAGKQMEKELQNACDRYFAKKKA